MREFVFKDIAAVTGDAMEVRRLAEVAPRPKGALNGRGAWPYDGQGGTFKYKSDQPGPYYYLGSGQANTTPAERAVHGGVLAYQRALNRELKAGIATDGIYGQETSDAVYDFQASNAVPNTSPWGGIGPDTSKYLLLPTVKQVVNGWDHDAHVTWQMVSGVFSTESMWDTGAVGYIDPTDWGLAQINGAAHPDFSEEERLRPIFATRFVLDLLSENFVYFKGATDPAIAAYNLGKGGANLWLKAGSPDWYTPPGQTTARNVRGYINKILAGG